MAAPATFIPDKAPRSFVPDAPSTFVADSVTGPAEFDLSVREAPDLQATTRGGPRVALPDEAVARASFRESLGEGLGAVVSQPGFAIPALSPSLQTVQKALDVTRAASEYETSGTIPNVSTEPTPPTTAAKVIAGGMEGIDELARGVAGFFTSGPGMIQLGAAATPIAPAVYLKWTVDMLNAGFTSAEEAWDAFQKSDWRNASKNTAIAFGSFLGAGAAAKHGRKLVEPLAEVAPGAERSGVRVKEAQQKALEATMPPQVKYEAQVLRQNNAPATAAVVEQLAKEAPRITPEQAEAGLRETLPVDETTDIRKAPTEISTAPTPPPTVQRPTPGQAVAEPVTETLWSSSEPKEGGAFYLSDKKTDAESYAQGRESKQWEVTVKKPFEPDTSKDVALVEAFDKLGGIYEAPQNPKFQKMLKDKGYDSVVGGEAGFGGPSKWVVVFDKSAVKSKPSQQTAPKEVAQPKAKEPWEMTAKDYSTFYYKTPTEQARVGNFPALAHKQSVREAIQEGKIFEHPDYPDLSPLKQLTPLQKQWRTIKDKHPDEIVLVRLGDFYEAFYGDAKTLAKDANVALTRRNEVPMAGVPYHAVDRYVKQLESAGHKVHLVEDYRTQTKPPEVLKDYPDLQPTPKPEGKGGETAEYVAVADSSSGRIQQKHIKFDPKKHRVSGGSLWEGDKNLGSIQRFYSEPTRAVEVFKPSQKGIKSLVKLSAEDRADPRMDEPGITRKGKPDWITISLRDKESRPIREIEITKGQDDITNAESVQRWIRSSAADDNRVSLRESSGTLMDSKGHGVTRYVISPNGPVWTSVEQLVTARAQQKAMREGKPVEQPPVKSEQAKAIEQPLPPLEMGTSYPYLNTIVQTIKLSSDGKKVQVRDLKSSTGKKEWVPVTKLNTARFLARADLIESGVTPKPQPKIEGMGGAIPEEFKPSQSLPTANKNASIDADRVARGESPLMAAMRQSDPELWDQAMRIVEDDWQAADKLIARHKAEPFTPNPTDVIVLLHRRTDLKNTFANLSRDYARASEEGRPEAAQAAKVSRDLILEQLRELEAVVGRGDTAMGTMQGRAFRARRLAMNEDYSLASLIVDREANLKRPLKPEEVAELEKISQDQAKASAELAKKEAELEARAQEIEAREIAARAAAEATADAPSPYVVKLVESIVKDWDARADRARARLRERMSRTSTGVDPTILVDLSEIGLSHLAHAGLNFTKWSARMIADVGEWAKPHLEEVFKRSQKLAESDVERRAGTKKAEVKKALATPTPVEAIDGLLKRVEKRFAKNPKYDFSHAARKIARYYVEQGITKPLELVDAVHAKLVEVMPELTKRETMDALSGYGRFIPLKKDAVSVALRDATGQMQQIAKLEDMAGGKAPLKSGPERRVPSDEERRLIKQVEEKKKEGGYDVTDPETQLRTAMQAAERRFQNQIADLTHQIETRTKIVKNKRKLELDDKLKALKEQRDSLKEIYDEVFAPEPLTDAQRLAKWKERTQEKIAEYQERIAERDFKPRKRPEQPRLDREAIKLRYELHKVHAALMDMRLRDELKNRTRARMLVDGVANIIRFSRALMTGGEFSAVLRQGGFTALSHPVLSAKALKPMFDALMSEKEQFRIMEEIQTRDNAPLYDRNKLQFTESGVRLSNMEEHYMFRVSERIANNPLAKYQIKFINAFQRAYTTYLNRIRADAFDTLLDTYGDSPAMQKQIANLINVATGRGSTAVGKYVGPGANAIFFAPRYTISRFQLLLGQPGWSGNAATRKMVAKEYARALAGAAVVYSLGLMAGGEVEEDPRSSDFGKVKFGNTRIDPLFGLAQVTRLLSTQVSGERVDKRGREIPIRGKVPFGQPNAWDVASSFTRTKLSPAVGASVSLAVGKDPAGRKFNLSDAIIQSATPITYGDILKAMEEQGVARGTAIAVLAMFGMGVQTYDANAKREQ